MMRSVAKRPLPGSAASHPDELFEARGQLAAERGTDEAVPASVDDRSITDSYSVAELAAASNPFTS